MLGFIKKNKDIEKLLKILEMDAANNYKDAAQMNFAELEQMYDSAVEKNGLKPKEKESYGSKIEGYREKLKGYSHKDQKPYWH